MGILKTDDTVTSFRNTNSRQRPAAQVWANVGKFMEIPTDEGSVERIFISLNGGVPVDTLEMRAAGSSHTMKAKNGLTRRIQELAADLAPGEERFLFMSQDQQWGVQIRRVSAEGETTPEEAGYLSAIDEISF